MTQPSMQFNILPQSTPKLKVIQVKVKLSVLKGIQLQETIIRSAPVGKTP